MNNEELQHWSRKYALEALKRGEDKVIICGGWSPSGVFHIGNAREMTTCHAFRKNLELNDAEGEFIFIIDDSDPLNKIPKVMKQYSKQLKPYLGHPMNRIPDFTGKYNSYAEYFSSGIKQAAEDWSIDVRFILASELYKEGRYDKYLELYLSREQDIQQIMEEISGSPLDGFFTVICENCGNAKTTRVTDASNLHQIKYICKTNGMYKGCGEELTTDVDNHNWKLKWRLDWPARQDFLGVKIEPAGKDHAAEGGSIDTAVAIHKTIFKKDPPLMPGFGFIVMKGKKMSGSSQGVPATLVKDIIDPYAFLFLIYRNNLKRDVDFNPGSNQYGELWDEYVATRRGMNGLEFSGTERELEKLSVACKLALPSELHNKIPVAIRFSELVLLYQTSFRDPDRLISKLKSMGKIQPGEDLDELRNRLKKIEYWLDNLAPSNYKFNLLDKPLDNIGEFWTDQITRIWVETLQEMKDENDPSAIINRLREKVNQAEINIKDVFKAFYQLLLGTNVGPNAGGLITSIGAEKIVEKIQSIQ